MKQKSLWMALMLTLAVLTACGEKTESPVETAPAVNNAATAEQVITKEAPVATSAGGYEPTADERVPGITMTQEELDKLYTETK